MGTGKTRISLEWSKDKVKDGILVIAPLKAIYTTWPDEIEKWGFPYKHVLLHGPEKAVNLKLKADVYLINFEAITWLFDTLKEQFKVTKKLPFRHLIIDEGSKIKDPSTKRFKALKVLRDIFFSHIILSGTPNPNTLLNLWSQYFILDGGERLFKSYSKFKTAYFMPLDYKQFTWDIRSKEHEQMIFDKVKDITFRLDATDYLDLPEVSYITTKLELPQKLRDQYKKLEKDFFISLDESTSVEAFSAATLSMKLRQFIQGGMYTDDKGTYMKIHSEKLDKLVEMVEDADGQGILCPIQFKFELELIRKAYPKVPAIVGGVNMKEATKHIRDWNEKKLPLLLCHPASLSHAVNMQHGSHIIVWYALPWSAEQYLQLNKRVDRNGQKHPVMIYHLCMTNTVDVGIMRALRSKIQNQKKFLDFIKDYHDFDL